MDGLTQQQSPPKGRLVNRILDDPSAQPAVGSDPNIPVVPPEQLAAMTGSQSPSLVEPSAHPLRDKILQSTLGIQPKRPAGGGPYEPHGLRNKVVGSLVDAGMGAARGAVGPSDTMFTGRQWAASPEFTERMRQEEMANQQALEDKRLKEMIAATQMRGQYGLESTGMRTAQSGANVAAQQAGAGQRVAEQQAGATNRTGMTVAGAASRQAAQLSQQLAEFRNTDQYRRWKEQLDNDTRLKVAMLTQSKAPAAMMQTAEFAIGGINALTDARTAFEDLQSKGLLQSWGADKMEDILFRNGLVDPSLDEQTKREISVLRNALQYTSSAAMRAHTGRTAMQIYDDFKNTLGLNQAPAALEGALDETDRMLGVYAGAASNENILRMRSGQTGQPTLKQKVTQPQGRVIRIP